MKCRLVYTGTGDAPVFIAEGREGEDQRLYRLNTHKGEFEGDEAVLHIFLSLDSLAGWTIDRNSIDMQGDEPLARREKTIIKRIQTQIIRRPMPGWK